MGRPRSIVGDKLEKLKQMTREGYSQSVIGDALGCSKRTVGIYQRENGLKASNRWRFGERAEMEPLQVKETPQYSVTQNAFVKIVGTTVELNGIRTKFKYYWKVENDSIIIDTGYCPPFEVDIVDFASFGNEVLDMAEQMQKLLEKLK